MGWGWWKRGIRGGVGRKPLKLMGGRWEKSQGKSSSKGGKERGVSLQEDEFCRGCEGNGFRGERGWTS